MRKLILILILFSHVSFAQEELMSEVVLYQSYVSGYDGNTLRHVNEFYARCKLHGNDVLLDRFWWFSCTNQNYTYVSIFNPSSTALSVVNSMTWASGIGYTGNGTSTYLNNNFDFSTATNYKQNSACVGLYISTVNTTGSPIDFSNFGTTTATEIATDLAGVAYFTINSLAEPSGTGITSPAQWYLVRNSSANFHLWLNGSDNGATTNTSAALVSHNGFIGCRDVSGTPSLFSKSTYAWHFAGGGGVGMLNMYNDSQVFVW